MKTYVVCMDSYRVRDTQIFDTSCFSMDELLQIDPFSADTEEFWRDAEVTPYIGVFNAENSEDACYKAAKEYNYDPRALYGIEIKMEDSVK